MKQLYKTLLTMGALMAPAAAPAEIITTLPSSAQEKDYTFSGETFTTYSGAVFYLQ